MGVTAQDVIKVMQGWIGKSRANGTHKDIIDLYNSHRPLARGYKVTYTDAYCDTTVSAAFIKLNATDLIGGTECGVERHIQLFKAKGIWNENGNITPKPGYIICFNWDDSTQPNDGAADHIGIVEKVEDGKITTIEGNYNGNVARRTIPVGWGYIRGYATPKYSPDPAPAKKEETANVVKRVIDISYAQGRIDWDAFEKEYKAGKYHGLIIRVGYGSDIASQDDIWYSVNIAEATKRGVPYGLYIYSYASTVSAIKSEIAHMTRLAKNRQPKIGVYIDLEENSLGKIAATAATMFCKAMNKLNYKAGVYCSSSYYKTWMPGLEKKIKSLWWIAAYGTNTGVPQYNYKPDVGFNYDGWQYTSVYKVGGMARGVDASEWYTDWEDKGQPDSKPVNDVGIKYRAHCQTYGWLPSVRDGMVCGTTGESKRLEALKITPPESVELEVDVHIQTYGWKTYKGIKKGKSSGTSSSENDPIMGTVGESKRLEAVRIRCVKNGTGKKLKYQAHVQGIGWQMVASEGQLAGTTGASKRMEAIKIWFE